MTAFQRMALSAMSSTHRCLGLCGKRGLSVSKYVLGTNQGVGSSKRASATTSRCQVPTLNQTAVTSEGMGILKCSQTSILQRAKVVCSAAFEAPVVSPDGDSSQRNLVGQQFSWGWVPGCFFTFIYFIFANVSSFGTSYHMKRGMIPQIKFVTPGCKHMPGFGAFHLLRG